MHIHVLDMGEVSRKVKVSWEYISQGQFSGSGIKGSSGEF